jgi:hypothetical protein
MILMSLLVENLTLNPKIYRYHMVRNEITEKYWKNSARPREKLDLNEF